MTAPHNPSSQLANQVLLGVGVGGAVLYVARKTLFANRTPVVVPDVTEPPAEVVPVPDPVYAQSVGSSGIIGAYSGPTAAPYYYNGATIPSGTGTGTIDTGTGSGTGSTGGSGSTGTGTTTGTGTGTTTGNDDDGLAWGAVIGGDEFNYTGAPNPALWGVYSGDDPNGGVRSPANVKVTGGTCLFSGNGGMAYHGPGTSRKTYRSKCRIRMSGSKGHPVLIWWPDNDAWPSGGEDDYMETDLNSSGYGAFIHHPNQNSAGAQYGAPRWNGDHTQWHIVAFERSTTTVTCWVDGVKWYSVSVSSTNGPPPGPMHPTIQLDQETSSDARFEIDYLRLYAAP